MNYLDQDITTTFTGLTSGKYYLYTVRVYDGANWYTAFVGNAYALTNSITIDITEILANIKYSQKFYGTDNHPMGLINTVKVTLNEVDHTTDVAFAYRYPNKNYSNWLDDYPEDVATITPLLQGTKQVDGIKYESSFLPHLPSISTTNYKLPFAFYVNREESANGEGSVTFYNGDDTLLTYDYQEGGNVVYLPLQANGDLYIEVPEWNTSTYGVYADGLAEEVTESEALAFLERDMAYEDAQPILDSILLGNTTLIKAFATSQEASAYYQMAAGYFEAWIDDVPVTSKSPIAIVDQCPSRYYLMWQDRLGGTQSQAFGKINTYSENLSTIEIQNYQGHNRVVTHTVESRWTLNTGWLLESEYPYYESIFTSPYLLLYDTKLDKAFPVILTDEAYTEKTFRNQKQMINLTINLKLDKSQIHYS